MKLIATDRINGFGIKKYRCEKIALITVATVTFQNGS